jgi:hypothetical protein
MAFPALLPAGAPEASLFRPDQHRAALADCAAGEAALPFVLFEQLNRLPAGSLAAAVHGESLAVRDADVLWVDGGLDRRLVERLSLEAQPPLAHDAVDREHLVAALTAIATVAPEAFALVGSYVRALLWVADRDDGRRGLISGSFPSLPYTVLLAPRAKHAIPPNTACSAPSVWLLADNLYHEAIHQAITMMILHERVLPKGYKATEAPRVRITWRDIDEGKAEWEIDRVLHAALVYRHLLEFRLAALTDGALTTEEREALTEATRGAVEALRFLVRALTEHRSAFGPVGEDLIGRLGDQAAERLPAAVLVLDGMVPA